MKKLILILTISLSGCSAEKWYTMGRYGGCYDLAEFSKSDPLISGAKSPSDIESKLKKAGVKYTLTKTKNLEGMMNLDVPSNVLESDADVTVNNLSTIVTYTIDSPTQGEWKVSLSNGSSSYLVRTYAQTDFGIAGLSLLKEAPLNIRNVQFMPIEGNPIAGDELLLRLSLTQAPDTLTLKLLSENQPIILEPVLTLVENSTKSYEATIVVPNENFNIKLEGMLNTTQFQREIPLSLKPTEVLKQLSSYQMSMVS